MSPVAAALAQEAVVVEQFVGLLHREQDILKSANAADLPAITEAKGSLITRLRDFEASRAAIIGMPADKKGAVEAWLANHPDDLDAAVAWAKLLELAIEAKALNQINGELVDMHLRQTNELLAVLTQTKEHTSLYGASGQSLASGGSRIVDSA